MNQLKNPDSRIRKYRLGLILISIIGLGFGTNWIWESIHVSLYIGYQNFAARLPLPLMLYVSLVDAIIVVGIYFFIALIRRNLYWVERIALSHVFLASGVGALVAVIIEKRALSAGKWAYGASMPIIPGLNVGLSPVLQMMVLPMVVFFLTKAITSQKIVNSK